MAVLALAGCANDPAPHEQMRLTEQAITQAKAVGATADEVPEMKLAEDKFNRAKGNMADESSRTPACAPSRPSWMRVWPKPKC